MIKTKSNNVRIGIIDFNPIRNPDTRQYVRRISKLIPDGFEVDGVFFKDNMDYSDYDALILSGSKLSATDYQEMVKHGKDIEGDYIFVNNAIQKLSHYKGPMFGTCFGSQIIALAFGGDLGKLEKTEAGYLKHQLTEDGRKDPVFGHMPDIFYGAHLHNDYVKSLPTAGENIVESQILAVRNNYIHAYKVVRSNGSILYGVQPHPEMSNPKDATFLVEINSNWLKDAMGESAYQKALIVRDNADFELAKTIAKFAENIKNV